MSSPIQKTTDYWVKVPQQWSKNPAKRRRFAQEAYFQECVDEFRDIASGSPTAVIANKSFIIFKPDAAAVRCVAKCMQVLAEYAIIPIWTDLFTFNRHTIRELWRYELNISTYERYPAIDALLTRGPSLFVLLEAELGAGIDDLPSFVNTLKGPSELSRRERHHIRNRIGAGDGVLNHIHTPDESLDVLREIGVLFERRKRREILGCLARPACATSDTGPIVENFYAQIEPHDLSVPGIRQRFLAQQDRLDFDALLLDAGRSTDFECFGRRLAEMGITASWWDALTLFVAKRHFAVDGVTPVLEYEENRVGVFYDG